MSLNFRLLFRLFLIALVGAFAGCAIPSAIKPGTTADELTQKLGKPTDVRPGLQGGESWDYVYGPVGVQTWRFDIDRSRVVSNSTQLLTTEQLYRVVPGVSTEEEVRTLLGRPRDIVKFREETAWEWNVAIGPDYGLFVVRFGPNGKATGVNVLKDYKFNDRDDR